MGDNFCDCVLSCNPFWKDVYSERTEFAPKEQMISWEQILTF